MKQSCQRYILLPSRDKRGMTLVELMLVMMILAIMTALAAPSLSRFFRGRSIVEDARRFVALADYGRSEAISQSVPMELWMDPESGAYGLEPLAGYAGVDNRRIDWNLSQGVTFVIDQSNLGDNGEASIVFSPDGVTDTESPARLELQGSGDDTIAIVKAEGLAAYAIERQEAVAP